jgi:cysteine dioxygenase
MDCVVPLGNLDKAVGFSDEPMEFSPSEMCSNSTISHGSSSQVPTKFADHDSVTPPASLKDLVAQLHDIFESDHISVEYVQTLMASYQSQHKEWKRFAKFDPHRYTRNLVDSGNGKFNLMVLCWNEGQGSSIHSHANSHCFLKVLGGAIKEELYEWPSSCQGDNQSSEISETSMKKWAENVYGKNECAYINDSIGLHRVENTSHTDTAVTLHLYSPPFDECQCFDERTGRSVASKVTFWSKFGRRTPFGRCPETVQASCPSDKN